RFGLFFLNKAIGETAVVIICLSFLLGPLAIILPFLRKRLYIRHHLGLTGFSLVLFHIIISLLQFTDRFSFDWYIHHAYGVLAAIGATLIFLVLAITSSEKAYKALGGKTWKTVQRVGYIALTLTGIHIAVAATDRWTLWLRGEVEMPSSVIVFCV